jgi:P27 family predicted phage terminase small subunit
MSPARGRPPKPLEEKRRTGNPGKRPLPDRTKTAALAPLTTIPDAPDALREPGRNAWLRFWTAGAAWLSPEADRLTVEAAAFLADEVDTLRGEVELHGHLVEEPIVTATGQVLSEVRLVANPAVAMLRKAEERLSKELSELGFTPSARARLGLAEVKRQSKVFDLLQKQAQHTADQ